MAMLAFITIIPTFKLLKTKEIQGYNMKRTDFEHIFIFLLVTLPLFVLLSILKAQYLNHLTALNITNIAFTTAILGILVVASYIDSKHHEIPYIASLLALGCVLLKIIVVDLILQTSPVISKFDIGITSGIFLLLVTLCLFGQLGGGDIQIMLPIFILFGNNIFNILIFLMALSVVGLITALPSIIRKKTLKISIPMAPSITGAFFVTALLSNVTSAFINI